MLGGGVARIGGRQFPLRHPHLALVIGLQVTAPETEREHEIRFVLLDSDGAEVAGATGSVVARSQRDGRDAILTFSIDLWNLTFPAPGDYSFRISSTARSASACRWCCSSPATPTGSRARRALARRMTEPGVAWTLPSPGRHERPAIDAAGLEAARHADRLLAAAQDLGLTRWATYLEPLPEHLRDDELAPLRADGDAGTRGVRPEGLGA